MDELDAAADSRSSPSPHFTTPPRSILVKEVNWLGDLVMSLPALRALRDTYPAANMAVLVKDDLAGFFDGVGWIDEVISYPRAFRGIRDKLSMIRGLRGRHFDLAVLFPNSFESALWMALAGVPQRVGYNTDARGLLLTDSATAAADARSGHQSRYWLGLLRDTIGVEAGVNSIEAGLGVSNSHRERMRTWLDARRVGHDSPLIALAPIAAYGPAKEWPLSQYAKLIDLLHEKLGAECVIIGAAGERARCEELALAASTGALVVAGEIALGETVALLTLCDGFIGNDSGAMHVAAAVSIPTVGIFGSTNPERTYPLGPKVRILRHPLPCSPCLARECRFSHYDCLRSISPEAVFEALTSLGVRAD